MEETNCYCSIVACIEHESSEMEQLLKDFLRDIQISFNILEFYHPEAFTTENDEAFTNGVLEKNPQSLAICFFLKEDTDLEFILKRHLEGSSWQLDHVVESSPTKRPLKIARQEFYSCSNTMPLMSVSSVHYGNEHVRFHINVKNFYAMKKFYEGITDRKARDCGPDFCFLTIHSEDGLDVQVGLKKNLAVFSSSQSSSFRLKFRIQSVSPLFKYLASSRHSSNRSYYVVQDPDGNDVIIERSYAKITNFNCELPDQVDENNNFGLEERFNSSHRKWSKYDYTKHSLFPEEAVSICDSSPINYEDNDSECMNILNRKEHITFV